MEATKAAVSPRVWSALYSCRPTSKAGHLFKRAWYEERYGFDPQRPPKPWREIAISIDCNFKKSDDSAYASIGVWARWDGPEMYRVDEARERWNYTEMRAVVRDMVHKWRPNLVLIEEAANGYALIEDLKTITTAVVAFKPGEYGSKEARAEVASPTHQAGNVRLPASAPWVADWIEEHVSFPTGTYKDRVDEAAQIVIYWAARARKGGSEAVVSATAAMLRVFGGG
jgi:predicted phage terminase large subunit-like protein